MSTIGKNIKKIRTVKKLSQAAFAELFNLARPSVGAYEEERAEPKIETVIQIANHFGISIDSLLTKELTINELYKFDLHVGELTRTKKKEKEDSLQKKETAFVPSSSQIEYLVQNMNRDFISGLPRIYVPGFDNNKVRAFELSTEEMQDNFRGLNKGDIVLGTFVKPENYSKLKNTHIYIFVLKNELIIRRFEKVGKRIFLKADNLNYEDREINLDEIVEVWDVQGYFTRQVSAPSLLADRILNLENTVQKIEKRLKEIENKNGQ